MGVVGRCIKGLIGVLLIINLLVYLVILGVASWYLDNFIDGQFDNFKIIGRRRNPYFAILRRNRSRSFMLTFALLGGTIGVCSVIAGLIHHRAGKSGRLAIAASSATIAWATTALAFGLVCKEMDMEPNRGTKLKTLEAFIIIATFSELVYLLVLCAGQIWT